MGARNKFYSICNQCLETPPSHVCFQNWNGSSATDIIVKGEQQHGIVNSNMVSDTLLSLVMVIAQFILASLKQFPWGIQLIR